MLAKIIGIATASILILAAIYAAGAYLGYFPNPLLRLFLDPPEHSARYYPQDTLAYAWLTLYPGGSQQDDMEDIWKRFNEFRAFRERFDELQEDFEEDTGIDLENDILPWFGPDISVGILEIGENGQPVVVATIRVRDQDTALIFLDQWLDYLEDTEGAEFETEALKDFDLWVDNDAGQAYALSEDRLLAALSPDDPGDVLEEVINLAADNEKSSLADHSDFQEARSQLSSSRFASLYVNTRRLSDSVDDFSNQMENYRALIDYGELPIWSAASIGWFERGVSLQAVAPSSEVPLRRLDKPANLLPDTTLVFVAFEDNYDLDAWRETWDDPSGNSLDNWVNVIIMLSEFADLLGPEQTYSLSDPMSYDTDPSDMYESLYWLVQARMTNPPDLKENPDLNDVMDLVLALVEEETGIDLETDLFDYLGGETILAVNNFDLDDVTNSPEDNPVDAMLIVQHHPDREEELDDTMKKVAESIEEYADVDFDPANIGADNQARMFEIDGYNPGYVINDGYLTLATTRNALETTVALQRGDLTSLYEVDEYQRALGHLPSERPLIIWANLHSIFSQLNSEDTGLTRSERRMMREAFSNFAASYNTNGSYSKISLVLTFFPE